MAVLIKVGYHKYYTKYNILQIETKKGSYVYDYYINPKYKIDKINCRIFGTNEWCPAILKWKNKYMVIYGPYKIYKLFDENQLEFDNTDNNFKIIDNI